MRRLVSLLLLWPTLALASSWGPPVPRLYSTGNEAGLTSYGFKVLPLPGQKVARAELFRLGMDGQPVTLWKGTLPNIPSNAYVSAFGQVVTLDTYRGDLGGKHALVIYDRAGRKLADYAFSEVGSGCRTCASMDGPFLLEGFRPTLDPSNGGRLLLKREGGGGPLVSLVTGKILRR